MNSKIIISLGLFALLAARAFGQNAAPAAASGVSNAPLSADESATLNRAMRNLIEQQDPTTKAIFDKYASFRLVRAPIPVVAAAPVPTIPRDSGPWTPADFSKANSSLPSLVVVGDSTAQTGDPAHRGWAALLVDYFDQSKINLVNPSIGGRSFRSFTYEGRWDKVVAGLKPGDIVFIQFGHNDGTGNDITNPNGRPELGGIGEQTQDVTRADGKVETVHTYGWYARKYITEARAKGAIPVMMTSTVYNRWPNGVFGRSGSNVAFARQVAEQEKVPLLDDTAIISDHYQTLGQDAVRPLFNADNLHTTTLGAIVNAEMFVSGVKALNLKPLVDALNDKGKALAAYQPAVPVAK